MGWNWDEAVLSDKMQVCPVSEPVPGGGAEDNTRGRVCSPLRFSRACTRRAAEYTEGGERKRPRLRFSAPSPEMGWSWDEAVLSDEM